MDKISYIAVDTNIFIEMAHLDVNYHPKKNENGYRNNLRDIKKLNANGHVVLVITPTVLSEILKVKKGLKESVIQREREFLKNHCLVYTPKDVEDFSMKTYELSKRYQKELVMGSKNGSNFMDTYVMAEASLLGLNLVTGNSRDFLYYSDDKGDNRKKCHRALDIQEVNKRAGLTYSTISGKRITPKPYSPNQFLEIFKTGMFAGKSNIKSMLSLGGG